MSYRQFPAGGDPDDDARLAAATQGPWLVSPWYAYVDQPHISPEAKIAGGIIDAILGHGMVALEEAIVGETRINTKNLWASLEGMPALAATFDKGTEAVFGAAGLIASEREVMRGYCLEALPAAEVAQFTGRTISGTESLIKRASKALRLLSQKVPTKSAKGVEDNEGSH